MITLTDREYEKLLNTIERMKSDLATISASAERWKSRFDSAVDRAVARALDPDNQGDPMFIHDAQLCAKAPHDPALGGYLHDAEDDGPYDVDGRSYCGRCHTALEDDRGIL